MGRPAIIESDPIPLPDEELLARLFRGLGDATRIRILELLLEGPRKQKEIVEALDVSQSRVSQHLSCLAWCGFVQAEREGRSVTYRIASPRVAALVDLGRVFLEGTTGDISSCRVVGDWEPPAEPNAVEAHGLEGNRHRSLA